MHWPDLIRMQDCQTLYSVLAKRGSKRRRVVARLAAAVAGGVKVSVALCGWSGWSERYSREEEGEY